MTITLDGSTGISTDTGFSCDGISFANNAPSNSLVVNSSGNVGIGTSSPSKKLSVNGDIRLGDAGGTGAIFTDASNGLRIMLPAVGTSTTEAMRIDSSGNVCIGSSTSYNSAGFGANVSLYNATSAAVTYQTAARQYQVGIASNGQYGVYDATSAVWALTFNSSQNAYFGNSVVAGGYLISTLNGGTSTTDPGIWGGTYGGNYGRLNFIKGTGSGTGSTPACQFYYNGTTVGSIGNTSTATTYNTSSDYRLKENIQPMRGALAVVQQLNPVTYTWKADGSDGQGFIAHELQAIVPDCVTGEKDAVDEEGNPVYQGIDTSFLVATLTKAIQELSAKNDALEARLTALEAK